METNLSSRIARQQDLLYSIAKVFWPGLESLSNQRRLVGTGDVIFFLYALPLALVGLVWLGSITDLTLAYQQLPAFLFIFGLIVLFNQVSYFIIVEIRTDRYGSSEGSLSTMILWSAVFLFGPAALWLMIVWNIAKFLFDWFRSSSPASRWSLLRDITFEIAIYTTAFLVALKFYQSAGGEFPISGLSPGTIAIAFATLILHLILTILIWLGYIFYHLRIQKILSSSYTAHPILKFSLLSLGLPFLSQPFAILAAGLFVENGFSFYLFLIVGLFLVAFLARQLSWAAESNRQQSRQLEKLEKLGRALIDAPPDASTLPTLLEEHVPNMFPSGNIAIWLAGEQVIFKHPADWPAVSEETWTWIMSQSQPAAILSKDRLPWDATKTEHLAVVVTPILESESARPLGGIYLELRSLVQAWDNRSLRNLFPATQTLAAQISSALHQAEVYSQALAFENVTQELRLAGKIQASFLPNKFPSLPGWQLAVTLQPARDTSGDFFDVIENSNGTLGILIADVADKGVGPALYMALSRTLIRTYAMDYEAEPEVVFFAANSRLLSDARANLFVTGFYGVLDPNTGILTYCNAGHNPPFLIQGKEEATIQALGRTGMALGIEEGSTWEQVSVQIFPGDILILYTDGIPDTQNEAGNFFDEERIIEIAQANRGRLAHEIQTTILEEVQRFATNTPQSDDITLMVLIRDE